MSEFRCELVKTVDDSYNIEIGRNLEEKLIGDIKSGMFGNIKNFAVITDTNVLKLYGAKICDMLIDEGYHAHLFAIQAGELSKTRETKGFVEDSMLGSGLRRDCMVVAVGGGVVSDLAGFVAGTFGRGVPFVIYSTTLLSAADASIGGKVAVDTALATNQIGMFNQPKKVYIDIASWITLPEREIRSGLAETIKHSCIGDKDFFEYLEKNIERVFTFDFDVCEHVAECNCKIKYNVVMRDEREQDLRSVLNLGHSVGRALETASGYMMLHGEAVAIGLVAQMRLGERYGYISRENVKRVEDLLKRVGLPTHIPDNVRKELIIDKLYTDKKVRNGKLRFVFQKEIGAMMCFDGCYTKEVEENEVAAVITQL